MKLIIFYVKLFFEGKALYNLFLTLTDNTNKFAFCLVFLLYFQHRLTGKGIFTWKKVLY